MNITSCPQCGGRVRSISIGWKCEGCNGFIDMSGQFHEHKDEPFMPPMTNADRIRAMSDEELAVFLESKRGCPTDDDCEYGVYATPKNCIKHWATWLQSPTEEDT